MDEDSNHYFEGATWRVGGCMTCTCNQGKIYCSRKIKLVSFSQFNHQLRLDWDYTFTEHCNQTECNVANFMKRNVGVCTGEGRNFMVTETGGPHTKVTGMIVRNFEKKKKFGRGPNNFLLLRSTEGVKRLNKFKPSFFCWWVTNEKN